jgi:hypothetical protein
VSRARKFREHRWGRILLLASAGLLATATSRDATFDSPGTVDPHGSQKELRAATIDDRLADLARRVPAFAGVHADERTVYVHLLDERPVTARTAIKGLREIYGADRFASRTIRTMSARYSFLQLKRWHDRVTHRLLSLPGVVLTDIDDGRNSIRVGVEDVTTHTGAVVTALTRYGVPLEAVDIEETGVDFMSSLQDRHRPLVGGLQIDRLRTKGDECTLGVVVHHTTGGAGVLTASHCTARLYKLDSQLGEPTVFYQPLAPARRSTQQDDRIAVEAIDPDFFSADRDEQDNCRRSPDAPGVERFCRYSEVAFAQIERNTVTYRRGRIAAVVNADTAWSGDAEADVFLVAGETSRERPIMKGDQVSKVGRSTGRTDGTVTDVCVNFRKLVVYPPVVRSYDVQLLCQVVAELTVMGGDSGSAVFSTPSGSSRQVVLHGILWGGGRARQAAFSPIEGIERDLGLVNSCAEPVQC